MKPPTLLDALLAVALGIVMCLLLFSHDLHNWLDKVMP